MNFRSEFDELSARFVQSYLAKDADGCAAAYCEDSELLLSSSTTIRGRAALSEIFRQGFSSGPQIEGLKTLWCEGSGDFGCAIQVTKGGKGNMYMLALRRDQDGKFRISREVLIQA